MDDSDDVIEQRPLLAIAVMLVVGAVAYAAISLVMRGTVETLEVSLFAIVFSVVYVAFAVYSETIESYFGTG